MNLSFSKKKFILAVIPLIVLVFTDLLLYFNNCVSLGGKRFIIPFFSCEIKNIIDRQTGLIAITLGVINYLVLSIPFFFKQIRYYFICLVLLLLVLPYLIIFFFPPRLVPPIF